MKGFTRNKKFVPMTEYKKVTRKSRDPEAKTQGTRLSRNRFHPKGHKPPTFEKKKPQFTVEITETEFVKKKESDSGEIPPEKIFDQGRLTKHDGRYFLVAEGFPDTLSVDEYKKINNNLFELERNVIFAQGGEAKDDLLSVTGGSKKTRFGYELTDEKKFLEGLGGAGALQESNFERKKRGGIKIKPEFRKGQIVMVAPDNENENYDSFRGKKLRIVSVSVNTDQHQGFDESVDEALYEFETLDGKSVDFSLYDYELVKA